ncbi:MAG: GNAT family N-acetyltransferase [Candidatus Binatia bacterium]
MRQATEQDLDFLAQCYVNIALHMKAGSQDLYISRLPSSPDDATLAQVARYVGRDGAIALIEELNGRAVGCLLGTIAHSSFSAARLDNVGHISACWVEPEFRQSGIATRLVRAAEDWFQEKRVLLVELSYMATNELAAVSWQRLGYQPFRIFAYKQL